MAKSDPKFGDLTESERAELAARIRYLVEQVGGRGAAAEVAQVSVGTLHAYVTGATAPAWLPVARLAQRAAVSLDWVASGRGAPRSPPSQPLNVELMTRANQAVAHLYARHQKALGLEAMHDATLVYAAVLAQVDDPTEATQVERALKGAAGAVEARWAMEHTPAPETTTTVRRRRSA